MEKKLKIALLYSIFLLIISVLGYGYAILSIHPVELVDYDTKLRTRVWWMTVTQNQMSDYAYGSISASSIKDSDTGATAEKSLEIRMSVDKQTCEYGITKGDPLYRWDYKKIGLPWWSCTDQRALEECAKVGAYWTHRVGCTVWCFIRYFEAWQGDIQTPRVNFKSTINIKAGGESYSGTINSLEQTEVSFPNDIAYARWTGSLTSGDECPKAKEEDVTAIYKNGKWYTSDYSDFISWKAYDISTCIMSVRSDTDADLCISEANRRLDIALAPKEFKSKGGNVAETYGTLENGKITITLPKLIQYPVINMYVKAAWLGVVMPYGIPEITEVSSIKFDPSKGTGYIVVKVKNVGKGEGSFAVYAQCTDPFSIRSTEYTPTLRPGEETTVNLVLYATPGVQETVKGTCKVIAYDRYKTENRDMKSVEVEASPIGGCIEGRKRCIGNVIQECVGGIWKDVQVCEYGCEYKDSDVVCKERPTPPECAWWDIGCHLKKAWEGFTEAMKQVLVWVGIIAIVVVFIWFGLPIIIGRFRR